MSLSAQQQRSQQQQKNAHIKNYKRKKSIDEKDEK